MASNASIFNIYHYDETGRPDKKYDPNDHMYVRLARSLGITQAALKHVAVVLAFRGVATKVGEERPNAWFLQGEGTFQSKTGRKTREFLDMFIERFPTIFVDDGTKYQTNRAHHSRYTWDKNFDLREQPIVLNGVLCQRMLRAAMAADPRKGKNDVLNREYRAFLFTISSSLLHELTHMFYTFLTKGDEFTPPTICADVAASWAETEMGESGLNMEQRLFGGVLALIRHPTATAPDPDKTCGIPYLITTTGWYRITQETIDKTVDCNFKYPYKISGENERHQSGNQTSWGEPCPPANAQMDHPD